VTFGSLAFSSIIPIIHGIIKYGWALQSERMGLKWVLVTLGLNTLGAAAYAIKVSNFKLQSHLFVVELLNMFLVSRKVV